MAVPTAAEFRVRYPFFDESTWDDDLIDEYIGEAALEVDECVFGKYYSKAIKLLAAHFMMLESQAMDSVNSGIQGSNNLSSLGAASALQSLSVGDTSLSYSRSAAMAGSDSDGTGTLNATQFGQGYLRLLSKVAKGGLVATQRITSETCTGVVGA